MFSLFTQQETAGLARHLLTTIGGALVSKGVIGAATLDLATGGVITLIGIVWSIAQKRGMAK